MMLSNDPLPIVNSHHFFSIYNFIYRTLGICLLEKNNNSQGDSVCFRYLSSICVISNVVRLSVGRVTVGLEKP